MGVRIALGPDDVPGWVGQAVSDGGGEVAGLADAEGLAWMGTGFEGPPEHGPEGLAGVLRSHPGIRWVQLPFAGVEPYAEAGTFDATRLWTAGKGVYAEPVAELALTLALAGLREVHRFARAREWQPQAGFSLHRRRVTIFGGGGITEALLRLLAPFDVEVTVVRRHPRPMQGVARVLSFGERYESLRAADVVVLALSLTPETRGFFGAEEFELMEPHALLVNVARGGLVDTEDLVIALRGGIIGGAGLDVTDPEPLPPGHPLWELPNCVITPHTGNTPDMAREFLSERIRENVRRYTAGEPLIGQVDPELGY